MPSPIVIGGETASFDVPKQMDPELRQTVAVVLDGYVVPPGERLDCVLQGKFDGMPSKIGHRRKQIVAARSRQRGDLIQFVESRRKTVGVSTPTLHHVPLTVARQKRFHLRRDVQNFRIVHEGIEIDHSQRIARVGG